MIIIKKIFEISLIFVNQLLIPTAIKLNLTNLIYYLFKLNLTEIKKISPKKKLYKIVVLSKLGGDRDLYLSQKKYNKNIVFYNIPRSFFKIIFNYFIDDHYDLNDYKYFLRKKDLDSKKKKYREFLEKLILKIQKNLNINCFIGFNFTYKAERELQAACQKNHVKFLALHKESVGTELEFKVIKHIYKNYIGKYKGDKIAVYNDIEKKLLISTKIAKKKDIEVIGCSRLDECFKYRKITPKKIILYYILDYQRGLPNRFFDIYKNGELNKIKGLNYDFRKISWKRLHIKIIENLKQFSKNNKDVEVILKGKQGFFNLTDYENLPKNFKVFFGGTGEHLLKDAKLVIGWNSTSVLEAIAANRFLIHPLFFGKKSFLKEASLRLNLNKQSILLNENQFQKKLYYFINKKYNKNILNNNIYPLKYYLNNTNGTSGKKLNNFILKNLKK